MINFGLPLSYFNKIIGELRARGRGHQEQILQWMMTLHGYLSSPTGGGVRHGTDLNEGLELGIDEARLGELCMAEIRTIDHSDSAE